MRATFLSLSPLKRFQKLLALVKKFRDSASANKVPFAILIYGSASYGFKEKKHGTLGDIDLFLIIPRDLPVENLIQTAQSVFQCKLEISSSHLTEMTSGSWDICRMYGEAEGVKLGFRLMCIDTLLSVCSSSGATADVRNVAIIGSSRIIVDQEWSMVEQKYVHTELEHREIRHSHGNLLLVNQYIFSPKKERLGALGRKLLTSNAVYDPFGQIRKSLLMIWVMFVELSLNKNTQVPVKDIINALIRSDRFSRSFRKKLSQRICRIRSNLL